MSIVPVRMATELEELYSAEGEFHCLLVHLGMIT